MTTQSDEQIFRNGVYWLANNGMTEMCDAMRLLGYLADTTDEIVLQAVCRLADDIAENERRAREMFPFNRWY